MTPPKVSVVIPCYKVEAYLDRCVASVLAQTMQELEIILVDDESPDRVPEMCDAWAARDARIRVIHKKNAGLGMACNSGLEVACGKYVAFLDSDDWVDTEMYQTMYEAAELHQAEMVFTGLRRVDEVGEVLGEMAHKDKFMLCRGREEIASLACDMVASEAAIPVERSLQMSAKTVLYSRQMIERRHLRFVSERQLVSEDLIFNLDSLMATQCAVVLPDIFYNYYVHQASLTGKAVGDTSRMERYLSIRQELLTRYKGISQDFPMRVNRMFIGYVRSLLLRTFQASDRTLAEKRSLFASISSHPIWPAIRVSYPVEQMPLKHRFLFECIMGRSFCAFYAISLILKIKK